MTDVVRLGAVSYLNARPLVYGLSGTATERPTNVGLRGPARMPVRFDVPAECARLLATGEIDLGLVPSITYLSRPGDRIVPGLAIASDGPVASVALFTRRPIRDVRTIALDTSSRTSAALTRILCARRFEIAPAFIEHAPDLAAMLARADAALLIGDPALFVDHAALGAQKIDLGGAWTEMTGLPFVWAFWVGRPDAAAAGTIEILRQACAAGVCASDQIADDYCAGDPARQQLARGYLRDNIKYDLHARAIAGLTRYYFEAASLGLVDRAGPIEFF